MSNKRILMVGPVPPPAGGVSIHITRLTHLLNNGYDVGLIDESRIPKEGILNLRKFDFPGYLRTLAASDVVHIHSGTRALKYAHVFFTRLMGKKTVLTIHSYKVKSRFFKKLDRLIYSIPQMTIVVGTEINETLRLKNQVSVKDAFLPPVLENEAPVPQEILDWIAGKKAEGNQIAIANAWRLKTHNGADQYGLDLCIEAAIALKAMDRKICFVYAISDPHGDLDITAYEKRIADNGVGEMIYLQKSQVSFVNLIQVSDIVLRPTNTDGDALTVREGLFFNKPTVASDAVKRPLETLLFNNRDADSFVRMIDVALSMNKSGAEKQPQSIDYSAFYRDAYATVMNEAIVPQPAIA